MSTQKTCPHSRMIHAEQSGPGVGARCIHLVEQIVKRYGPKVANVKAYALTKEERESLFASGAMLPPVPQEDEKKRKRATYRFHGKVAIPPEYRARLDATLVEALAHIKKHGHVYGYLKKLARARDVNYNTLTSHIYRVQEVAGTARRNAA